MNNANSTNDSEMNNDKKRKSRTLRWSVDADKVAVQMADDLGITVNELLRRALGTEKFLIDAQKKGSQILLKSKDDKMTEVVMR